MRHLEKLLSLSALLVNGATFAAGLPSATVTANTWWHSKSAPYGGANLLSEPNSEGSASYNYQGNEYFNATFLAKAQTESGPLPSLYIENSVATGLGTSLAYSDAVETDATFTYYFSIDGPASGLLAPIRIGGVYIIKASGGLATTRVALDGPGNGFPSMGFPGCSTSQCDTWEWFFKDYEIRTGAQYKLTMSANIVARAVGGGGSAWSSAYIDPYISVDAAWALDHAGYSVLVSEGVGNTAPIPEPSQCALFAAGLGLLGVASRGRRCR